MKLKKKGSVSYLPHHDAGISEWHTRKLKDRWYRFFSVIAGLLIFFLTSMSHAARFNDDTQEQLDHFAPLIAYWLENPTPATLFALNALTVTQNEGARNHLSSHPLPGKFLVATLFNSLPVTLGDAENMNANEFSAPSFPLYVAEKSIGNLESSDARYNETELPVAIERGKRSSWMFDAVLHAGANRDESILSPLRSVGRSPVSFTHDTQNETGIPQMHNYAAQWRLNNNVFLSLAEPSDALSVFTRPGEESDNSSKLTAIAFALPKVSLHLQASDGMANFVEQVDQHIKELAKRLQSGSLGEKVTSADKASATAAELIKLSNRSIDKRYGSDPGIVSPNESKTVQWWRNHGNVVTKRQYFSDFEESTVSLPHFWSDVFGHSPRYEIVFRNSELSRVNLSFSTKSHFPLKTDITGSYPEHNEGSTAFNAAFRFPNTCFSDRNMLLWVDLGDHSSNASTSRPVELIEAVRQRGEQDPNHSSRPHSRPRYKIYRP